MFLSFGRMCALTGFDANEVGFTTIEDIQFRYISYTCVMDRSIESIRCACKLSFTMLDAIEISEMVNWSARTRPTLTVTRSQNFVLTNFR